jgi:hypothetical protein
MAERGVQLALMRFSIYLALLLRGREGWGRGCVVRTACHPRAGGGGAPTYKHTHRLLPLLINTDHHQIHCERKREREASCDNFSLLQLFSCQQLPSVQNLVQKAAQRRRAAQLLLPCRAGTARILLPPPPPRGEEDLSFRNWPPGVTSVQGGTFCCF